MQFKFLGLMRYRATATAKTSREVFMISIRELFTKDVKPFKTIPLRKFGLAAGISYCIAALLSWLVYSTLNAFGVTHIRFPIVLPLGLAYLIYHQWLVYAKSKKKEG